MKAIIAVFGGGEEVHPTIWAKAGSLGGRIGHMGGIVLSGGRHPKPNSGAVRVSAINGADGNRCPWIGVVREKVASAGMNPTFKTDGTGCEIRLDLGNARNYVEAHLCDAAIALDGGDGTLSEILFSLLLGKPVALVGDCWIEFFAVLGKGRDTDFDAFKIRAFRRVCENGVANSELKARMDALGGSANGDLARLPGRMCRLFDANADEKAIVQWALEAPRQERGFEFLGNPGDANNLYSRAAKQFKQWLDRERAHA